MDKGVPVSQAELRSVLQNGENKRTVLLAAALLVLAAVACYANSFGGVFIFDDEEHVINNPAYRQLWPLTDTMFNWRAYMHPLKGLSFALNYAISRHNTWSYHLFNLIVHVIAGLALFGFARRALCLKKLASIAPSAAATPLAFMIALLWVVHPLNTQAVTYIYQRSESMMGMFFLLAMYFFMRAIDEAEPAPGSPFWSTLAVLAAVCSVCSKQVGYAILPLALVFDRTFVAGSFGEALKRRGILYGGFALSWTVMFLLMITAPVTAEVGFDLGITPFGYLVSQAGVILHYLRLSIVPTPLCFDYGWHLASTARDIAPGMAVVVPLFALTAWALWKKHAAGFLGAWFFLILAPTSSIFPIRDLAFENRMYLPLVSVLSLLVVAAARFLPALAGLPGRLLFAGGIVIAAVLGVLTVDRNYDYHSGFAIWQDVIVKRPWHFRGYGNVGFEYYKAGDYARAIEYSKKAIAIKPDNFEGHNILGSSYFVLGRQNEAEKEFLSVLKLKPEAYDVMNNLGFLYHVQGRNAEALQLLLRAKTLMPGASNVRNNLAKVLAAMGDAAGAEKETKEYERLRPLDERR
ncbi:MAG: hypothetical protein A2583_03910 [Bdellovibrionales bacterium RIFOXYD1_FULL_53_11]|nr:MAG: hypothetical protein A2583_03910 [Bdellovibrionales bacterium RIFOXYD1_FULL_53_11]